MSRKTWEDREADIDRLTRDLEEREVTAQLDTDTRRSLAKLGESLNLSAAPLTRFLVLLGAMYMRKVDLEALNVIRALTDGDVNLEGPAYELPF